MDATATSSLQRITLIGTGNVGTHLARRLTARGRRLVQLVGRRAANLQDLADELSVPAVTDFSRLDPTADLYLLAVPDAAISEVAARLAEVLPASALVVHTSGATPTTAIGAYFSRTGVLYPLQSFNRDQLVDWSQVPMLYFAAHPADEAACAELAAAMSPHSARVDDAQRARLHVAAVFANNFPNALFDIAYRITSTAELDFGLLLPLIRNTVARLDGETPPAHWQTGPAVRDDQITIERHLRMLGEHPDWQQVYRILSNLIQN